MKAIQIEEFGGPEVLRHVEVHDPVGGEGEVVVEVARSGINFADTHATRNDYLAEQTLPLIPGAEVSGRTPDGRRVAAILAERRLRREGGRAGVLRLVPVPDEVDDDQAAALLLQGLTAMALVRRCARIEPGETDGASRPRPAAPAASPCSSPSGPGRRVIGLASSEEKRALVEELGADATVDSRAERPEGRRSSRPNGGEKVDAVLQMSGGDAFDAELSAPGADGADGRLRDRLARAAQGLHGGAAAADSKSVIGFWLVHVLARRDLVRR